MSVVNTNCRYGLLNSAIGNGVTVSFQLADNYFILSFEQKIAALITRSTGVLHSIAPILEDAFHVKFECWSTQPVDSFKI